MRPSTITLPLSPAVVRKLPEVVTVEVTVDSALTAAGEGALAVAAEGPLPATTLATVGGLFTASTCSSHLRLLSSPQSTLLAFLCLFW